MRPLAFILVIQLMIVGCSKRDGTITGNIIPPASGVIITAIQKGKSVVSTEASTEDGRFRLSLTPGTYEVRISARLLPYPMMFQNIVVEPDKVADLSAIQLPVQIPGSAVLSGRIIPAQAHARISLFSGEQERAAVNTDSEGKYVFKELSPGAYIVHANAEQYAPDTAPVTLSESAPATHNLRLFYASALDGVDWAAGKIRVTGTGIPPRKAPNETVRREMARRAALADGQRKLAKILGELEVSPDKTLKSHLGDKNFSHQVQGFVRRYQIVSERVLSDGRLEVDLELPVTGQNGLSRFLPD